MVLPSLNKFGFRIRTRQGSVVENLVIQGKDADDAERKLRQMYMHCEILESSAHSNMPHADARNFEDVISLLTR